jgi:hypothetical protein
MIFRNLALLLLLCYAVHPSMIMSNNAKERGGRPNISTSHSTRPRSTPAFISGKAPIVTSIQTMIQDYLQLQIYQHVPRQQQHPSAALLATPPYVPTQSRSNQPRRRVLWSKRTNGIAVSMATGVFSERTSMD